MGIVLLATGIVLTIYSEWGQDKLRTSVVAALNKHEGMQVRLDSFRLRFPLDLNIAGVALVQDCDTMVTADTLQAKVKLMPLLKGRVEIDKAELKNAYYQMGSPDSLMWLRLWAGDVTLKPATVELSTMDIRLSDGKISDGTVDMVLRQDTVNTPSDTTAATQMKISLEKLELERFTYRMSMLPTIDSLGTSIGRGELRHGVIDLMAQRLTLRSMTGSSLAAAYIAPDSATVASTPVPPPSAEESTSAPWTIEIDTIHFADSKALYTTRGVDPLPGLDFAYIQADSMDLLINGFYNQSTTLRMPLRLHAVERCGVALNATGTFSLDSTAMYIKGFDITTPLTSIKADGMMGMGDLLTDTSLPLRLTAEGECAFADLMKMFPGYAPYISLFPKKGNARIDLDLQGTAGSIDIDRMRLDINRCVQLNASGSLQNVFSATGMGGDIDFRGRILDVNSIVAAFTDPSMGLKIPPMTIGGKARINGGNMAADLKATTLGGKIALDARYNSITEGYALDLSAHEFPVNAFMPDLGVGKATMTLKAKGRSFDMSARNASMDASATIHSIEYSGYIYKDATLEASLHDGEAKINAGIHNEAIQAAINAEGNLNGDTYSWTARLDGEHIDMLALKLSETPMQISLQMDGDAQYTPKTNDINARLLLPELYYKGDQNMEFTITDITARFHANDSLTNLTLDNRDLAAHLSFPSGLNEISSHVDSLMAVLDRQIAVKHLNVDSIQKAMPQFVLDITAGDDNLINDVLKPSKMSIKHLSLSAQNDSTLSLNSTINSFSTGSMLLDTVRVGAQQVDEKLHMLASLNNRKGNLDEFAHVRLDGMLNLNNVSVRIIQQNSSGETGYDFGAIAMLADSTVTGRFFPLNPVIGYKKWTINFDNFLKYDFADKHIDANLKMRGDDSSLQLFTNHTHIHGEEHTDSVNNVTLKISDIHLQDWISFNPFAPPISGDLSADVNLLWNGGNDINGNGDVALNNFLYDKKKVASMQLNFDVATNISGTVRAKADLMVDGEKTMTLAGNLNDSESESPFKLDFSLIRFPLSTVNPFLPEDMAQLTGVLNGQMLISGDSDNPIINGEIDFEKAAVRVGMVNTSYAFSDVKIPVEDNIVTLENFEIRGANENPLRINGKVDIKSMSDPRYDLTMKAQNMMVVNSEKAARNAVLFGKGYVDLDVAAKGNLNFLQLDANLTILAGTNVTYVMLESPEELTSSAQDMVKFVNLNDSAAVAVADSLVNQEMLMALDATLTIQNGTVINVELPSSGPGTGSGKAQVQAEGTLTYTLSPLQDEGRLLGRLMINGGFARYTLPVVGSEKRFSFDRGSYIAFNGDILNPVLNIHASDRLKANVTQEGSNSRLVNFDIGLSVTGTLDKMDVAFDLSTDDDLTVANELQSMSPEQRANQAMNMLLYNMYTGPGTSASANLSGNPLFSFLESQLNNWAANNIKGVDLSFGIDQYNKTTNGYTSSAMTYSYQVSKTLFNDRFKIIVGGNYSTDNNADENIAENLINDISFEYFLNQQQTMLVKLFRHMGFESILEGEVTQTGVGFVYRRKLDRLGRMLPKFMRPKYKN